VCEKWTLTAEAVPGLKRVAFVSTQGAWDAPGGRAVREAAEKLGILLTSAPLVSPFDEPEYRRVLVSIQRDQIDGIMISEETENYPHRFLLVQLINQMRLPAVFSYREQAEAGGLLAYSWDLKSSFRRNAMQVAQILPHIRGTRLA
jgi:putative ABC transport system substrate-binding protein